MNDRPIGIIDSGLGGLTILGSLQKLLPKESFLYVADHAHSPYSEKTELFIRKRIRKLIEFLENKGTRLVVIACNTATVAGIDWYRKQFPQMILVGVVPVVKTAVQLSSNKRFAVLSTTRTTKSLYLHKLISEFAGNSEVIPIGSPSLVGLVEAGKINGPVVRKTLIKILEPLKKRGVDTIVLGCTHFPFLSPAIRAIVGEETQILDSGDAVARQVKRMLPKNKIAKARSRKQIHFFTTGDNKRTTQIASTLVGKSTIFTHANI